MTAEQIVQQNLDAYNARDIDTFMSFFADDIMLYNFGIHEPTAVGKAKVRAIYEQLFMASPALHSSIKNRIVFDNKVIDYEDITGRLGQKDTVEMVLIYEVEEEKIIRITAIKKIIPHLCTKP
jgi:hypothetical protein